MNLAEFATTATLCDGAVGAALQARGLAERFPPEMLNEQRPDAVETLAREYIEAGSRVIVTNTFNAHRLALDQYRHGQRAAALAEAGARIAVRAAAQAPHKVLVVGALGPSGKVVMTGEVSGEKLHEAYHEAAEALAWGGVDAILLETFSEIDELRFALRAVSKAASLPVIVSMRFSFGDDKTRTVMGNSPEELARLARQEGAGAVGVNCGVGPDAMLVAVGQLRAASPVPVWARPDAGEPVIGADRQTVFPMGPEEFARHGAALAVAGANFIGGCCGTTPAHIRRLREAL